MYAISNLIPLCTIHISPKQSNFTLHLNCIRSINLHKQTGNKIKIKIKETKIMRVEEFKSTSLEKSSNRSPEDFELYFRDVVSTCVVKNVRTFAKFACIHPFLQLILKETVTSLS